MAARLPSYDALIDQAVQQLLLSMRSGAPEPDGAHVDGAATTMLEALAVLAGGQADEYRRRDCEQVHADVLARLGERLCVTVEGGDATSLFDVLRQAARVD